MTTQVDQNREDGRISQDTTTPTAGTNQADNPVAGILNNEQFYVAGDLSVAYQALQQYLGNDQLDSLKTEIRNYRETYPDADINDVLGLIAGVQARNKLTWVSDLRLERPETKEEL